MSGKKSLFAFLAPLMVLSVVNAQSKVPFKSPAKFVGAFYAWYTPVALKDNATPAWDTALRSRMSDFSPQLRHLLKEDLDAQAACKELVGLDFDPILGSQEPAERYEVGRVTKTGQAYHLEIFAVRSGERSEKPDVKCELAEKKGHFFFTNFFYRDGRDLLTILKSSKPVCSVPR